MKMLQATFLSLLIATIASARTIPSTRSQNFAAVVTINAGINFTECVKATDATLSNGSPVAMWVYFDCVHNKAT